MIKNTKNTKSIIKKIIKYNVKYRNQKLELDYTKRKILSRQRVRKGKRYKRKNVNIDIKVKRGNKFVLYIFFIKF